MVLNNDGDANDAPAHHPYKYARVLGIYHANVIYVGPGIPDYQSRRMEFLWVRWYRNTGTIVNGWNDRLDRINFGSMADDDTFGFLDPSIVLRGCHLIPAFAKGKLHRDGKGMSLCAQDSLDWTEYYVNRWVC
jgi:hypothetical protein